ncbi:hypothetical protein EBR57_08705 [bacterium]|nr:hypothetical protein [bacterium]
MSKQKSNSPKLFLAFGVVMLSFAWNGYSQSTVSTPIVGFMKLSLPAGKASLVSFPLDQQPLVSGVLTGKSGTTLTTTADLSGLSANLSNSDNEAVYYIELTSGTKSGLISEIVGKGAGSLSVSSQDAASIGGTETFQIKKFKTIADIFGANNSAGLLGGDSTSTADVIWAVTNGNWRQYFFYDDGFAGEIDPLQWQTPGSIASKADSRIDPDQGVLIIRKAGSDKSATITGIVKSTPSFVPFINGVQIVTNPYPVDKTLGTLGLKTGNSNTGLVEGDSTANSDVVYKLDNGAWRQYFVYNDGFNGDIDPVDWQTPGSVSSQAGVIVSAGEALLIVRRGNSFTWNVAGP